MKRSHTQSQNFIRSPQIVKTLVGHSLIKKSDTVIDIGAGSGTISSVLAEKCARVIAVEPDQKTFAILRRNMEPYGNVTLLQEDFLDMTLPGEPYTVFANIPFHLSSPIIRRLTETPNPPNAIYLIVQRQFAQKLLIGDYSFTGQLGALIAPLFTARIRYKLQRTDYTPQPAVDTVFLELLRRKNPLIHTADMPRYRDFVEHCFSRQKYFATLGMVDKKPSELTVEQWVTLFRTML